MKRYEFTLKVGRAPEATVKIHIYSTPYTMRRGLDRDAKARNITNLVAKKVGTSQNHRSSD